MPLSRRRLLVALSAAPLCAPLCAPAIVRAQSKDLVVGGAAGMAGYMKEFVFPVIEKKHGMRIVFDGTRSLVNLEKMRADRGAPKMSVVLMDDPVMQLAFEEGLLAPLTPGATPNLGKIKPDAIHADGAWANYQQPWVGLAANTKLSPGGVPGYAALWEPGMKGRVIVPSLQNTEGLWTLLAASHLATGKPFSEAQYDMEPGFKKMAALKPNVLTVYTNQPQAENLLESGEASVMAGQFSSYTLVRAAAGAPVALLPPAEGSCAMPSGICKVKNGPNGQAADAFIDAFLGPEIQGILVEKSFVLPTNPAAAIPAGFVVPKELFVPDWANVNKNRTAWLARWNEVMG